MYDQFSNNVLALATDFSVDLLSRLIISPHHNSLVSPTKSPHNLGGVKNNRLKTTASE